MLLQNGVTNKIPYHLINLRIAIQQTTVKIAAIINKMKNSVQDIPIKSVRNIIKNSTKYYKNIIPKKTIRIQAVNKGYPMLESRQSLIYH